MGKYFEKYKRFLGAVFLLWLFLWTGKKLGFDFGVDLRLLFRTVLGMGVIGVMGEMWVNWGTIYPLLKDFLATRKNEFSSRTKATQAGIIAFSPKILGSRFGGFIVLPLAVGIGVFREFGGVGRKFSRVLFSKEGILFFGVLGILGDILVLDFSSGLIILFLTGLWIWSVRRYKFEGRVSVGGGLVFLLMCPFLLIFEEKPIIPEKAAVWAYMFLVIGTVQMLAGSLKEGRKNVNLAR